MWGRRNRTRKLIQLLDLHLDTELSMAAYGQGRMCVYIRIRAMSRTYQCRRVWNASHSYHRRRYQGVRLHRHQSLQMPHLPQRWQALYLLLDR